MDLARALKDLARAVRRFAPDQGRVARGNARQATRQSCRRILDLMDRQWPVIPRAPRARQVASGPKARAARDTKIRRKLTQAGWQPISGQDFTVVADMALAGIRPKKFGGALWVPGWCKRVPVGHERPGILARLKRSPEARAAYFVATALQNQKPDTTTMI